MHDHDLDFSVGNRLARRQFLQSAGAICLSSGALGGLAWAGPDDRGPKLRKGNAQTPEEARKELEEFKATYSDLAGWEKTQGADPSRHSRRSSALALARKDAAEAPVLQQTRLRRL